MPPAKNSKNVSYLQTNVRKPPRHLSLVEKIEVINYYKEARCSVRKLAKIFNIGKTQAGRILREEEKLFKILKYDGNYTRKCKLRPDSAGFQIDKLVFDWYSENKQDMQVSGVMIQNKALDLAKEMGFDDFKASNGWLASFLKRHKIVFNTKLKKEREAKSNSANNGHSNCAFSPSVSVIKSDDGENEKTDENTDFSFTFVNSNNGYDEQNESMDFAYAESKSIDENSDEWRESLMRILPNYAAENIFSAIQTGLFYKAVPNNTSQLIRENCSCGKLSTDRFTVLFCFNMSGEKEKPLIVASAEKSNSVKNNDSSIDCVSDEKAWLTQDVVTKWLEEMDFRIGKKKDRKILLFLNHTMPRCNCELKNIQLVYFPPFLSCESGPVNQKIIQNFKITYRQHLLKHLIELSNNDDENDVLADQPVSESQAINWISLAWEELSRYVIHKSFEELEFYSLVKNAHIDDNETSASLDEVSNLLCALGSDVSAMDYVGIDSNLVTEYSFEPVEILVDTEAWRHCLSDDDDEDSESEQRRTSTSIKSYADALQSLEDLKEFYASKNDLSCSLLINQLIAYNELSVSSDKGPKEEHL